LPDSIEKELGLTFHPNTESMVRVCDVVTINAPLPETENLFNAQLIAKMKRGAYIVNTAAGKSATGMPLQSPPQYATSRTQPRAEVS
jgi:formate dehydrogenase